LLKHLAFPRNQIFKSKLDGMMVMLAIFSTVSFGCC